MSRLNGERVSADGPPASVGLPMELLNEGVETGERRVDGGDGLMLPADHLSADDVSELFPPS